MKPVVALLLCLALVTPASAATPPKKVDPKKAGAAEPKYVLTVDHIMQGPNLYGYAPQNARWSGDGKRIYFQWKQYTDAPDKELDLYVANADGSGAPKKLSDEELRLAPPVTGVWDAPKRRVVHAQAGDIWIYDYRNDQAKRLTRTSDPETNPHWSADGKQVLFTRGNNLFAISLEDGTVEQWTDIRTGPATDEEKKGTDSQEYLKKEELELLEVIKRRAERKKETEERRKKENPRKPFRLAARQSIAGMRLTPDSKYVIAMVRETAEGSKTAGVPNYITADVYAETMPARTKVGDRQGSTRLLVLDAKTGESKWFDAGLKTKIKEKDQEKEVNREVNWGAYQFSEDGKHAVAMVRARDNKDAWLVALDPSTGKARTLVAMHDDAWLRGDLMQQFGFMKDDRQVWFLWEKTGYAHLYKVAVEGEPVEPIQLTSGKWEIDRVTLTRDRGAFYLETNEVHPGEQHLYRMSAEGGERLKLTSLTGRYENAALSPDESQVAILYSAAAKPTELYTMSAQPGNTPKQLTTSPSPDFAKYNWTTPPVITIPARDGATIYARLYKPATAAKGGPAVVFVHGAGYLQNAHKGWSTYAREYLFHHLLAERGYTVLDLDYRGSAGYGRDWRTGIYRYMGGKDLEDNVDGAKWLVETQGVDPKRIGLYGGSYGGFITLMALFTTPDVFAAGAALRPVTDWAQYNHPYTSNILNEPQKDAEAYKRSSPIYFAQNLKGALLICHGMVDVNVHYQDSVRLAQRLIELRKENWELASYPIEDHGFVQPTSWADEYKRILKLFETHLKSPKSGA